MKRIGLIFLLLTAFSLIACKTTQSVDTSDTGQDGELVPGDATDSSQPADNADARSRADAARQSAIAAGAEGLDAYNTVEALYAAARALDATGADATAAYVDVEARYTALENYAKARALKKRIDDEELASYNMTDYNRGEQELSGLDAAFADPTVSGNALIERTGRAISSYNKVLNAAFNQLAKTARTEAIAAKRRADSVMAGVAEREEYAACVSEMRSGDSSFSLHNSESAYRHYRTAAERFERLYDVVSVRRRQAQEAIDAARRRTEESAQFAAQADTVAPITDENLDGIEAPDAVLLEEETYENPEDAVADIPDTVDAEEAQ
ncbi:MAG: hypothetical protein IJ191_07105 [Treponema sp.]|nr:hypothetical protein [Treponema sp.]